LAVALCLTIFVLPLSIKAKQIATIFLQPRLSERQVSPTRSISELRTPNSQLQTPNSELRTPNSELRTPNSELPTPNSELRTPNSQLPTPNPELRTPNPKCPLTSKRSISILPP
jgi:hypothetical protein